MPDWSDMVRQSADPCFVALRADDANLFREQLASGRSVRESFHAGRTFLHIAAELGAIHCAELLLQHGADLEQKMEFGGDSPLILAVAYGHTELARYFLSKGARLRYEWTPEVSADAKSKMQEDFKRQAKDAQEKLASMLSFSIEDQSEAFVGSLMDVSLRTRGVYALEECHDLPTLRLLVDEYHCDVNHHDGAGYWPLKSFAESGDATAVKFLLERGADPSFTSTGDTALHSAVTANSLECVRLLLEAGANANQQDVDGRVPMCRVSSNEVLDLLLKFGADPNITDQCGLKPSHSIESPEIKARIERLDPFHSKS